MSSPILPWEKTAGAAANASAPAPHRPRRLGAPRALSARRPGRASASVRRPHPVADPGLGVRRGGQQGRYGHELSDLAVGEDRRGRGERQCSGLSARRPGRASASVRRPHPVADPGLGQDVARALGHHAGKVLTHAHLLREVWGNAADPQYLRVYVRQLRLRRTRSTESSPARKTGRSPPTASWWRSAVRIRASSSGHDLLAQIRGLKPDLPVIVLSSRDDEAGKVEALCASTTW
jgi:hypothetical protein